MTEGRKRKRKYEKEAGEGERQREGGREVDGYDSNNENKQDRMRGEEGDEEEDGRMLLYAEIQKPQATSHDVMRRRRMTGDERRERW